MPALWDARQVCNLHLKIHKLGIVKKTGMICFDIGKLALWYDQMRGEFCVSLPCKHSFRVFSLTIIPIMGTAGSPKLKKKTLLFGSCWCDRRFLMVMICAKCLRAWPLKLQKGDNFG